MTASTPSTNPDKSSESRMRRRVRRRQTPLTYLPHASVAVREDELLARRWGCKPESAHQRKLRIPQEARDVIEVKRELGHLDSLADWYGPIEDAMAAAPRSDAELRADVTDAQEDEAQAAFRANPCEDTARTLLRRRAAERQASLDHDREIATRYGLQL